MRLHHAHCNYINCTHTVYSTYWPFLVLLVVNTVHLHSYLTDKKHYITTFEQVETTLQLLTISINYGSSIYI